MWRGSVSPHSGGTVPDLHRIPLPLAGLWAETSIAPGMARSRALTVWLPVFAWAAVIFAFSSIPSLSSGLGVWDTVLRKGAHVTEYAVLGALLYRALGREAPALAAGIAYAATDELHQHFVRGRHASPVDVAIDAVGVALGMLVWLRVRQR
jgi:VanZ family protein